MVSAVFYITLQLLNCSGFIFSLRVDIVHLINSHIIIIIECHGLGLAPCGFGLVVYGLGLLCSVNIPDTNCTKFYYLISLK